jgi:hypothetical protein
MEIKNIKFDKLSAIEINDGVLIVEFEDMLAWRLLPTNEDLFILLQNEDLFKSNKISAKNRSWAAEKVRKENLMNYGQSYATLTNIYELLVKKNNPLETSNINSFITKEIEILANHLSCQIQILEVIKNAASKGLKVFLITELEFTKNEIFELLKMIDLKIIDNIHGVFSPCELKIGSFTKQINAIIESGVFGDTSIYYLGNKIDEKTISISKQKLTYYRFKDNDSTLTEEIFINRNNIATQILPDIKYKTPNTDRSRYPISLFTGDSAWNEFGYKSIGPIIFDFVAFIFDQLSDAKSHVAFLMRDGHLPKKAFNKLYPEISSGELSISRFSAISSCIRTSDDIYELVQSNYYFNELTTLLKLLNFDIDEQNEFIDKLKKLNLSNPLRTIFEVLTSEIYFDKILYRSKAKGKRLKAHIYKNMKCKPNDRIVLVDLGYAGTVQNYLSKIANELELDFSGCYLITDQKASYVNPDSKQSLIDANKNDPRIVDALLSNISLLEMVCSAPRLSTLDYTDDGDVITSQGILKSQIPIQNLNEIQQGVIDYCKIASTISGCNNSAYRYSEVIINLTRYLYSPAFSELILFEGLRFDLDMGTDASIELFNSEKLIKELENFGYQNINNGDVLTKRFHTPYEIRAVSPFLASSYFNKQRYGSNFDISLVDLSNSSAKIERQDSYGKTLSTYQTYPVKTFNSFFSMAHSFIFDGNSILFEIPGSAYSVLQVNEAYVRSSKDGRVIKKIGLNDENVEHTMTTIHDNLYTTANKFLIKIKFSADLASFIGVNCIVSISYRKI